MPSPNAPVTPDTVTCGCGHLVPIVPPRRKSGTYIPTCANCTRPTGYHIVFERSNGTCTYTIRTNALVPSDRRVDRSLPASAMSALESYLAAKYPALMIQSQEPDRVLGSVHDICSRKHKGLFVWDCVTGIRQVLPPNPSTPPDSADQVEIEDLHQLLKRSHTLPARSVLVIRNLHAFLPDISVMQHIENQIRQWQLAEITLIGLAPQVTLPAEVERLFTVVEAPLPTAAEIHEILRDIATNNDLTLSDELEPLTRAASGLTRFEIENAGCLSILRTGTLDPVILAQEKGQLVQKHGSLTLGNFTERFEDIGGMRYLRKWAIERFAQHHAKPELPFRGALLLGLGGSGKSAFVKALGNHVGWPTLCLDFGKIMSGERGREGIVGSAESMLRRALQIADAMSPCLLFIEELDKSLGGVQSSHATDGGVGSRLFGTFLTWLQDHTTDVFVIGCSNRMDHIPPEFTRSGRFDAVFFCDLPTAEERGEILDIYAAKYGIEIPADIESQLDLEHWTGAELKQLCIETAFHKQGDLLEAAHMIKPLYKPLINTEVKKLRDWAATRCLSAQRAPEIRRPPHPNSTAPTSSSARSLDN